METTKFNKFPVPGSARKRDKALRNALAEAFHKCPKSRAQIAEELSVALGIRVTVCMLNDYIAESRIKCRFPAAWLAPLAEILGDDSLFREVLPPHLLICMEIGKRELCAHRERDAAVRKLFQSAEDAR